ncbi:MAG: aminopeptidase, partial [Pygmaiobacter sp.]
MKKELLQKYADFAVEIGVGVLPGQTLIIQVPVEAAEFGRMCAKSAFRVGARDVVVKYTDEQLARVRYENATVETLCDVKPYVERSYLDYVESEGGACVLHIIAENPEAFSGIDAVKIDKANTAKRSALAEWRSYTMNDRVAWCIVAVPCPAWASKVFPGAKDAEEQLWNAIFDVCRVTGG